MGGEGVCPGEVREGVLWSASAAGGRDRRPCPSPLIGKGVLGIVNFHNNIIVLNLFSVLYLMCTL